MQVKNAVLVSLNIRLWQANRQDKRVSDAVTEANEVKDKRLGRFWKSLLPKCAVLDKLYAIQRAARTFHYQNTHAWMQDGPRVLLTENYEPYMEVMRKHKTEYESTVLDLVEQYDAIIVDAKAVLGKLFNSSDYPSKAVLQGRYSFAMDVAALPAADGLLQLGIESDEAEDLRSKYEADLMDTFQKANRRLWEDMHMRLEKLTLKLRDGDAYVKKETIAAVQDLADLLPRLNITNDEKLDMLASRLKSSLADVNEATIKNDPSVRKRVAAETQTVFNVMQAFMAPQRAKAAGSSSPTEMKRAA